MEPEKTAIAYFVVVDRGDFAGEGPEAGLSQVGAENLGAILGDCAESLPQFHQAALCVLDENYARAEMFRQKILQGLDALMAPYEQQEGFALSLYHHCGQLKVYPANYEEMSGLTNAMLSTCFPSLQEFEVICTIYTNIPGIQPPPTKYDA